MLLTRGIKAFSVLLKPTNKKLTLWSSFGDTLVDNLNNSIEEKVGGEVVLCEICGERVDKTNNKTTFCKECYKKKNRSEAKERMREYRKRKKLNNVTF